MSYILDALNKAEQTRKQGSEDIQVVQSASASNTSQKQNNKLIMTLLMLSIGLILLWLILSPLPQESISMIDKAPVSVPIENKEQPISSVPHQPKVVSIQKNTNISDNTIDTLPDTNTEPVSAPSVTTTITPTIMNLPQHIRDTLPAINISAHIHGEVAGKRMVIINNKVLHENDYISEHLILKTITKHGVELEFDGTLFSMTALDTWPFE